MCTLSFSFSLSLSVRHSRVEFARKLVVFVRAPADILWVAAQLDEHLRNVKAAGGMWYTDPRDHIGAGKALEMQALRSGQESW